MSVETNLSKTYGQVNILLGKNMNSNILPSGKLPLPLANNFTNFFIDKIDKIMRGLQTFHISEDVFFDSRFSSKK